MVLHKRLDYGFNGYQVPPTPRAARSVRKRVPFKKKNEDNKMCAFDLLAIVAGNLLNEGESSSNASGNKDRYAALDYPNDTVKAELQDEDKSLKEEVHDHGSSARTFFVSDILPGADGQNCSPKECPSSQGVLDLGLASTIVPDCGESINDVKLVHGQDKIETAAISGKVGVGSSEFRELEDSKLEGGINRIIKDEPNKFGNLLNEPVGNMCSLEEPDVLDGKPPAHVSSDSSAKAAMSGNHTPVRSYLENKDVGVVSRDDDENSSRCTHPRTTKKFLRAAPRIGDRRIRKILASKYWKATPRMKDMTHSNTDGEMKPVYRSRKNYYKAQRSERLYPFKKRKHFGYYSPSNSNGEISCELGLDSHQKANNGATGASSSVSGQYTSFQTRDSHVKLRIKSFRVPELFIEIPESATVGTLKRTVMDAVTAILGGGLRIGILLRGKKVRDDSKTLQQTGISHNHQLDALGFSLEPSAPKTPSLCPGESPLLLTGDTPQHLSRYAPTSVMHQGDASSPENHVANMGDCIESDHDSAPSPTNMSVDKNTIDSKALVVVPPMNVEALAVIPSQRKSKRSEIAQRRIRRPFSVTEVEALVQAVEKLGTGRWRDVKLRAFDNAKHRTYVDLKDKWKTLVHTARISPQQRRGEPVPQELLDRVLNAHAYWSQQQLKHPETCHNLL